MMRALVVNCSSPYYNLGAAKLTDWLRGQGYAVETWHSRPGMFALGFDLICLSVIFSWDALKARDIALLLKNEAEVWCGGPGMSALGNWWRQETGLECTRGLDFRFDRQRGRYEYTFASRGCPVNCSFCIVPRIEGRTFTLDWDFQPAPILCDNNLSALPDDFQEHIIHRYSEERVTLRDANSGFEPHTFCEETRYRWAPILKGPWRFAYDTLDEGQEVRRMMNTLKDVNPKRKRVYVLIGNEPVEACLERVTKVLEWGGEPYCQPFTPLNALRRDAWKIAYDWTPQKLRDLQRWANRFLWKYTPFDDYDRSVRTRRILHRRRRDI